MNIDGASFETLSEGQEVTLSVRAFIVEKGGNYLTMDVGNGDEIDVSEGSEWFIDAT